MKALRVYVTARRNRFIAESDLPSIVAIGGSVQAAAENARLMAIALIGSAPAPATIFVQSKEPGRICLLVQPLGKPIEMIAPARHAEAVESFT